MLKQLHFIGMESSYVVTEYESKTWLSIALIFIVLSWNILGLHSPNKSRAGGCDHSSPPAHRWREPRMGSLGSQKFLRKGDLGRSMKPGQQGEEQGVTGGRNGQEKMLGSHRASLSCGNLGAAEKTAAFPSPSSPSWFSTEVYRGTSLLPHLSCPLISLLRHPYVPKPQKHHYKRKGSQRWKAARAEHPRKTVLTKSEQRVSTLGKAENQQQLLHLKLKEE